MHDVETVVVGAGVVGLAVARELARSGREVVIVERASRFGAGTSSRNSEVIHAGIYYAPGSLKASLCVEGRELLYAYCAERGVGHRRCGKLIVATQEAHEGKLAEIERRARASGVEDLRWLTAPEALALEPALRVRTALLSPSTGIIDSHGLMVALLGDAEDRGAALALMSEVRRIERRGDGFVLHVDADRETTRLRCRELINCAGLGATAIAAAIEGLPEAQRPTGRMAKGNYFTLTGRSPFRHLVYPIPNEAGLGIHLTIDLGGQARFGPDVEWVDTEDYAVDPSRRARFAEEIREYWPAVPEHALVPGYAGIRPKLVGPGEVARDFLIGGPADHGVPGFVNLLGMESPGLTANLAIARLVRSLLEGGSANIA